MVSIDGAVVSECTRVLRAKDNNQRDKALVASAIVHGFVPVTRNVNDMRGGKIQVLNAFKAPPVVEIF